ncbi:hypothetical protein PoB_005929000 [Plakobranchus ocellatus]|uniref:Sulfatase N-terminal domain-containing protein n=1 Tax=Plakobranchus ocellatus TaxID=259542 RepID=A0AAV4CIU4_9GAST|nr:hypothetical protein PoB_005929000 [Plakobranchus ocellatus]
MSILMIGIDGMSKQHFERAMPETRNFLLEKKGAIELYKYNNFAAWITHDDSDLAYQGNEAYHKFLQDLVATDSLNNTVIFWFSDHGPRFGPIRETYHGRIETSTPYIFFVFPPWFKRKYPQLISTHKINQNSLSSHFDVYETIRDLLYLKNLPRKNGSQKERGISLFREIPRERTCDNAGIPGEFCACGRFSKPKMNATSLQVLGATLLRRVNSFIGFSSPEIHNTSKTFTVSDPSHSSSGQLATSGRIKSEDSKIPASAGEFTSKCTRLSLVRVESVYQVTNDQLQSLKKKSYRVTIRTAPGLALFEALINYEPGKSSHVAVDAVRINIYRG